MVTGLNTSKMKDSLAKLLDLDGAIATCLVDSETGMTLAANAGVGGVDLEIAAAGNTEVVRAKRRTMASLKLQDGIEDILITLGKQYHLIRPLSSNSAIFLYLVLDRKRGNLAMARLHLSSVEKELVV